MEGVSYESLRKARMEREASSKILEPRVPGGCRAQESTAFGNGLETNPGERRRLAANMSRAKGAVCRHIAITGNESQLPRAHGKEGVDGSSPSEGLRKGPQAGLSR